MSSKKSRNLSVLQAQDAAVSDIVEEVAHIEVYKFDPAQAKWDKMGVAGAGFIVHRSVEPLYQFVVLNKQGKVVSHCSLGIQLFLNIPDFPMLSLPIIHLSMCPPPSPFLDRD